MNPNLLKSIVDAQQRANTKKAEKQKKKEIKRERRQERIASFHQQIGRNNDLSERTRALVQSTHDLPGRNPGSRRERRDYTPWFVLKKGEGDQPWAFGRIAKREFRKSYAWEFETTVATGDLPMRAIKDPEIDFHPQPNHWSGVERTYAVPQYARDFADGEIFKKAASLSKERRLSPVKGVKRAIELKKVDARLGQLEETFQMFQQALTDSELNPHLQPLLLENAERRAQVEQQAQLPSGG